jgi:putative ABC transport system ATP-binding protein
MEDKSVFEVKNLNKTFGDNEENLVRALNKVDLKIKKGEFSALVGPSGSGKTTLLNIMSGLENPTSGSVFLDGEDISHLTGDQLSDFRRDHIGFIFQAYNLIPVLTVKENIEYIMLLQGVDKNTRSQKVRSILKDVGLEGKEDRFPTQLSGGQQQRVAVARAMVSMPNIILADEPTANLDSKTGMALVDMMKDLNEKYGTTFVFSTHDPIIMERAKRLVTLKDGAIEKDEIR